jgi:hypothetical protein
VVHRIDLRKKYGIGLGTLEMALKSGMRLDIVGSSLRVSGPEGEHDRLDAQLMNKALKANQGEVSAITTNPEALRQALSEAQKRMVEANGWVMDHFDLWDRLETIHRRFHPEDTRCVREEGICLEDAMVTCSACVGRSRGGN